MGIAVGRNSVLYTELNFLALEVRPECNTCIRFSDQATKAVACCEYFLCCC